MPQEADARAAVERALQNARTELETTLADSARLGGELEEQAAECVTLRADLANARADEAERDAIRAQRDSMALERDAVVTQLDASNGRVHALESSQARHEGTIRQLETALEHARQAEARSREQAAGVEQETVGMQAETEALRGEVARVITLLDASVQTVDELASMGTVPELLAALVKGLAVEFPRVALFRVKDNCVEGELQVGFEQATDVTKFVFPLTLDSLLTRVVSSGAIERLTGSALAAHGATPFGGTPAAALALPIVLQGEPLAVVYAEDSDRGPMSHKASVGFAKLLVAETVVLLMRHTHELKTLNELREYASMLLREAEQMHAADVEAGKGEDELRARLKGNLDCARQLYAHRAALEGSAAALLLDEQIAAAMEAETRSPGSGVGRRPPERKEGTAQGRSVVATRCSSFSPFSRDQTLDNGVPFGALRFPLQVTRRTGRRDRHRINTPDRGNSDVMTLDSTTIAAAAATYADQDPHEILRACLSRVCPDLAISFSGAEDVVLIDMAAKIGGAFRVFSLDTGRLHPETYQFLEKVRGALRDPDRGVLSPAETAQALVREKGLFSFYRDGHKECCGIRKVEPLVRAFARQAPG